MYKYLPIEQAKIGNVVEAIDNKNRTGTTAGKLYVILPLPTNQSIGCYMKDNGTYSEGIILTSTYWKLVKTKPLNQAKVNDTVMKIANDVGDWNIGAVSKVYAVDTEMIYCTNDAVISITNSNFVILCKTDEQGQEPTIRYNLAFYKRSKEPWTKKEYETICDYCGCMPYRDYRCITGTYKYIFDSGVGHRTPYEAWCNVNDKQQETHQNFKNCKQVAYEDVFQATTNRDVFTITTNQSKKETTMNELQQLLSTIFGAEKPTTDYDKRPQLLVVVYSLDGKKVATATADSVEQVVTEVKRNPALWGCKVLTYKLGKELFVDVPVSITKAKVAVESDEE